MLSQVSPVKQKLEKVWKTLPGHMKSDDGPHTARGLDSTDLDNASPRSLHRGTKCNSQPNIGDKIIFA